MSSGVMTCVRSFKKLTMSSGVVIKPHSFDGIFVAHCGKEASFLVTKNLVPGEALYNEKIITLENEDGSEDEYRVWDPFLSRLAAYILIGVDNIWIKPGDHVLYLGAGSGSTVSHVSDVVGPAGVVYAVEISPDSGHKLVNMAQKRTNVIPIIEDARDPTKYKTLVGMVDVIYCVVEQPDQARILALNASSYLKIGGHFVISIKANWRDSNANFLDGVHASEYRKLIADGFQPVEEATLEPFIPLTLEPFNMGDYVCMISGYRKPKEEKDAM